MAINLSTTRKYTGTARGWSMEVHGLKELEQLMLKELPATAARKVTLSAIRASAKPMLAAAKRNAPYESGALEMSIGLKAMSLQVMLRGKGDAFAGMTLSPLSKMEAWVRWMTHYRRSINIVRDGKVDVGAIGRIRHAHLVEFGFRHHSGKFVRPRPFLRKAFDEQSDAFIQLFTKRLRTRVLNAVKKHNQRSRIK